jgi:hypothetical protein
MAARWQTPDDQQQTAWLAARPMYTDVRMLEKALKTATRGHSLGGSALLVIGKR